MDQFRKVRKAAGTKRTHMLVRTGGMPASVYGQAVTGVSNSHPLDQRRAVAAAGVSAGAGHLDVTLAIIDGSEKGRTDPAFAVHCDPTGSWAEAVWCLWLPTHVLSSFISKALLAFQFCTNTWSCVRAPGAAFVASAQRLG